MKDSSNLHRYIRNIYSIMSCIVIAIGYIIVFNRGILIYFFQCNISKNKEERLNKIMKVVGVIPARYKSSRFPGKPLANICGKPMIWWVYQQCLKVDKLSEIYVATDDVRIMETCEKFSMNVIMTSSEHQTGSDRVGEVATKVDGDLFINIQGDEPLIDPREIEEVIDIFEDESVEFGSLRIEITDPEEIAAYSTVKVVVDRDSDALYFSRNVIPYILVFAD